MELQIALARIKSLENECKELYEKQEELNEKLKNEPQPVKQEMLVTQLKNLRDSEKQERANIKELKQKQRDLKLQEKQLREKIKKSDGEGKQNEKMQAEMLDIQRKLQGLTQDELKAVQNEKAVVERQEGIWILYETVDQVRSMYKQKIKELRKEMTRLTSGENLKEMLRQVNEDPSVMTSDLPVLLQKILPFFVFCVSPHNVLHIIHAHNPQVLVEQDMQTVQCLTDNHGSVRGARELFTRLVHYKGWLSCIVNVLRDPKVQQNHVADKIVEVVENLESDEQDSFSSEVKIFFLEEMKRQTSHVEMPQESIDIITGQGERGQHPLPYPDTDRKLKDQVNQLTEEKRQMELYKEKTDGEIATLKAEIGKHKQEKEEQRNLLESFSLEHEKVTEEMKALRTEGMMMTTKLNKVREQKKNLQQEKEKLMKEKAVLEWRLQQEMSTDKNAEIQAELARVQDRMLQLEEELKKATSGENKDREQYEEMFTLLDNHLKRFFTRQGLQDYLIKDIPVTGSNYLSFYNEEILRKIRTLFVQHVIPLNVLHMFHKYNTSILTQHDIEAVDTTTRNHGRFVGAAELLSRLTRYKDWFPCLLQVLRNPLVKQQHVADAMERLGTVGSEDEDPDTTNVKTFWEESNRKTSQAKMLQHPLGTVGSEERDPDTTNVKTFWEESNRQTSQLELLQDSLENQHEVRGEKLTGEINQKNKEKKSSYTNIGQLQELSQTQEAQVKKLTEEIYRKSEEKERADEDIENLKDEIKKKDARHRSDTQTLNTQLDWFMKENAGLQEEVKRLKELLKTLPIFGFEAHTNWTPIQQGTAITNYKTVETNPGGHFNPVTGVYAVPQDGWYHVTFSCDYQSCDLHLYHVKVSNKRCTEICRTRSQFDKGVHQATHDCQVHRGDTLFLKGWSGAGQDIGVTVGFSVSYLQDKR